MKQKITKLLISLREAIIEGLIWIFPRAEKILVCTILLTLFCILMGCGTQRQVSQLVEHTTVDTVYLSNIQYDSIYIYQESNKDYHRGDLKLSEPAEGMKLLETVDTIYIKDVATQYRYKLLRDTIYKTKVDSIPYQVTVIETKEITRPRTTFDIISYWCFGLVIGFLLFKLFKLLKPFLSL